MAGTKKEKNRHLGRGLQSLLSPIISETVGLKYAVPIGEVRANLPPDKELQNSLRNISLDSIQSNPFQPRTVWNQQELNDLAKKMPEKVVELENDYMDWALRCGARV